MEPLYDRVLAFIADPAADRFEDLALAIFAHQVSRCAAYRDFASRRGATPATIGDWRDVPPVPVVAFKHAALTCGPPQRTFRSSGTTAGADTRSRHLLPDLRLYRASALAGLRRFLFPDVERMRAVSLVAPGVELPDSSLAQMVDWALETFASEGTHAAHADGLDLDRLVAALDASERDGTPLAILTTSGALIHALDALRVRGSTFRLPHGSRLMDTGGDKGAPRRLSRHGLLHAVWNAFAIPGYFVVNEYGMAELSSQYYDSALADRVAGRHAPRRKRGPHWARARILDPLTLAPADPGQVGLLCHVDLANAGSAMAILSEDLAVAVADGFELRGRAPGAETRGCSLAAAQWAPPPFAAAVADPSPGERGSGRAGWEARQEPVDGARGGPRPPDDL